MPEAQAKYRFDVAFSFASPHRKHVLAIAELVAARLGKERVFYDDWYRHEILGDDMDVLLQSFYHRESLMVVADLSEDYTDRRWCQAEARAIRALRFSLISSRDQIQRLRILDLRFGDDDVPGTFETTGYLDGANEAAADCANLILKRFNLLVSRMNRQNPSIQSPAFVEEAKKDNEPPILFFYPATNDEFYARREEDLLWLDDCASETNIRIAAITGVGGLGKTSLAGHWIQKHQGWKNRSFCGVFFYSFYSDRSVRAFFNALLGFVCKNENIIELPKNRPLHRIAATALNRWSYLVVLDGLEVHQHEEEDFHYGRISDDELNEFIAQAASSGDSLLLLTSRFPFPDLKGADDSPIRTRGLSLLSASEGRDLLEKCGLVETHSRLEYYSRQFGGHPLALRIFAGACLTQPLHDPETVMKLVQLDDGTVTSPRHHETGATSAEQQLQQQRNRFYKLLRWFQEKLTPSKRRLLQLVALFREPVPTETLIALVNGMEAMREDFTECDTAKVRTLLDDMIRSHLLQREQEPHSDVTRWTAHPIIRETFRQQALQGSRMIATQFAEIVTGGKKRSRPRTIAELQPFLEAIDVLLSAGHVEAADTLYESRLEEGWIFLWIPALQEGIRCTRAFIEPKSHYNRLSQVLGERRAAFYLNEVAVLMVHLGSLDGVLQKYEESTAMDHARHAWELTSVGLQNICDALTILGQLHEAISSGTEALFYAGVDSSVSTPSLRPPKFKRPSSLPTYSEEEACDAFAFRANAYSLNGQLAAASADFVKSRDIDLKGGQPSEELYADRCILWCYHRLRLGEVAAVAPLSNEIHDLCKLNNWNHVLARCMLLSGEIAFRTADVALADRQTQKALKSFRKAQMLEDLADALLAMARIHRIRRGRTTRRSELRGSFRMEESAIADTEEALRLSVRGGFKLKQCDILSFRAQLRCQGGALVQSYEDARRALDIADRCGYYWGRHEALRQLCQASKALGNRADEKHWTESEKELTAAMSAEFEAALRINRDHDLQLQRLHRPKGKRKTT